MESDNNEYIFKNFNPIDIPRCPKCNLISSLELNYINHQPTINYQCENKHKGKMYLKDYMNIYNKYSLINQKCQECNEKNKVNIAQFYCSKCKKFLCKICHLNHINGDKHDIMNLQRYDALCKIHSNLYDSYCINCKQNLCIYCKSNHQLHELIDFSKFNYSNKAKNKLEEGILYFENIIKNLESLKQNIISLIEYLIKSSELDLKFFKILLYTYQYEEKQHNLNYNIIQNLNNYQKTFQINKTEIYEKIYNSGNKFTSYIKEFIESNCFKYKLKSISNHNKKINLLSELNDGRLVSCSDDGTFNIYKKDSYEIQISVKQEKNYSRYTQNYDDEIYSFTELNNGKIILCTKKSKMKLIKLLNDKYEIVQNITEHNDKVYKAIELKQNEIISISNDKTMKIWVFDNKEELKCITNINLSNSNECNIIKLNEKEFAVLFFNDKCIKFWNVNNYTLITTINDIESSSSLNNMCLLESDILCIGGKNLKGFYLIQISNHQIIKNILGPKNIYSINKCFDCSFLCSIYNENGKYCLIKYKYEKQTLIKIIEKVEAHNNKIYTCIELNNGIIVSGGEDGVINLWSDYDN